MSVPNNKVLNEMGSENLQEKTMFTIKETLPNFHASLNFHDPVSNFHMKKKLEKTELH